MNTWYDSEVYGGHAKSNVSAQDIYYGPKNKKEDPCGTCLYSLLVSMSVKRLLLGVTQATMQMKLLVSSRNLQRKLHKGIDKLPIMW